MTQSLRNRKNSALAAGTVLTVVLLAAGCSDDKSNNGGAGPRFDPDAITIVVGDTVRFVSVTGDHTVTSGTGSNDPNSGDLFNANIPQGDAYRHVFNNVGVIPYYCIPHEADGMTGTVTVTAPASKRVEVFASGAAFNPANVTINVGDSVRWTISGSHTVTSGVNASDPAAGDLFDEILSDQQTFTYKFEVAGVFPYFCRVHLGMTGTVTVVVPASKTVEVEALE